LKKFSYLKSFLPAIIWTVAVFALSVSPGVQLPEITQSPDKIGHFLAYGLLTWLYLWALQKEHKWSRKSVLVILLAVSGYGIVLEFVQWGFFPNRFFEVLDMAANVCGVLISYLAFRLFIFKT